MHSDFAEPQGDVSTLSWSDTDRPRSAAQNIDMRRDRPASGGPPDHRFRADALASGVELLRVAELEA
jgi:hypothetical protein